ncbi:MAG: hypothetical protein H7329_13110 [Opitutaceae bacterium]|nr:hypothetical protein [Cytophagales bacterium]
MSRYILVITFIISFYHSYSQEIVNEKKNKIYLDAYWGGPQLTPIVINSNMNKVHAKGLGPFGARADFFLSDRHSLGVDVNYMQIYLSSTSTFYVTENGMKSGAPLNSYTFSKLRVYLRYAYHMIQKDKIDFYLHAGIGASIWSPNQIKIEEVNSASNGYTTSVKYVEVKNAVPIGFRTGIGFRYLFTKNIGLNVDLGLGGPLLTAGLTLRLK